MEKKKIYSKKENHLSKTTNENNKKQENNINSNKKQIENENSINIVNSNEKNNISILLVLTIVLILIDQISKFLISKIGNIGNGFFRIENVYNSGIAFGINSDNIKNIILSVFVICIVIYFTYNQRKMIDRRTTIALSMVIAGGISNIIDRIFRGAIFDFIAIWKFPIFNLADSFVVIGWILFIICLIIFSVKKR
jgi:signal peptidase II